MPAAAIPLIASGVSAGAGIYNSYKQRKQQSQQQQQMQPAVDAQMRLGGQAERQGNQLFNTGMQAMRPAMGYYDALLRGDRAQLMEATAPDRAAITDVYRGAEQGLARTGSQGATRDVAAANLNRDRAGRLAATVTGVRGQAANALGGMAQFAVNAGNPANAAGIYSQLLGGMNSRAESEQRANIYRDTQDEKLFNNIGQLFVQGYGAWNNRGGGAVPYNRQGN